MPTLFGKNSVSEELEEKATSTGASPSVPCPCRGPSQGEVYTRHCSVNTFLSRDECGWLNGLGQASYLGLKICYLFSSLCVY